MKTREQQIDSVATMLAAAYWRGRLNSIAMNTANSTVEAMIKAAAQSEKNQWLASATLAVD
jgi:hypothetical protein